MPIFAPTITADMAKLVDVPDLGSGAARRVGSSPIIRTKNNPTFLNTDCWVFCFYEVAKPLPNFKVILCFLYYFFQKGFSDLNKRFT